jgi:hypothetical protein
VVRTFHLLRPGGGFRLVACAAASMPVAPLARARTLDQADDERRCMSAVKRRRARSARNKQRRARIDEARRAENSVL